jgi:O-antigen ligase
MAVAVGDSATAQLGALVACLTFPAAFAAPRIVRLLGLATVLLTLAIAPVMGTLASRTLGQAVDQAMPGAHAGDRIAIWRSFEVAALKRPWFGNGFGSSLNMQNAPVAAEVPADRVTLLGSSHPHNAFLQVWVELGLVGALLVAALAVLLFRAIGRMAPWLQPYALTTVAAACTVALVSHGAWQAWWMATLLAASVHFAAIPPRAATFVTPA